ncbi:MAG: hypothetical protein HZA01_06170 [Nitrospinae bacterium]|nr:hypothetical protein [Nitrospinota bacterium]
MFFLAEFEMLPDTRYEEVSSKILSWEREMETGHFAFKIIGKYGFYGARKGFFIIEADNIDAFYLCIRHFRDVYSWDLAPIHPLKDFSKYCGGK